MKLSVPIPALRSLPFVSSRPRVCVVRLSGVIGTRRGLQEHTLAPVLKKAFRAKPTAVALVINSPGGSPVQSSLIGSTIRRLADETETPVVAFVEDVAASGGYWLATAADEIFIDENSIIGSIGVISAGFGLHEFINRYGIERRIYTAGKSKCMNDMFKPERKQDVDRLKNLLGDIHTSFKAHVTRRRGGKLSSETDLFTGDIWVGQAGVDLGLADGIGHLIPVMKERFGKDVRFRTFAPKRAFASRFGVRLFDDAIDALDERAAFARYGL